MSKHIEKKCPYMKLDEDIVFFAFRYALGRRTGSVGIVVDYLQNNWKLLTDRTQNQIQKEIGEAISKDEAGAKCDIEEWRKLL